MLEAVRALPEAEVIGTTDDGVVTELRGELAKIGYMHTDDRASADALLRPVLGTVLKPFRLAAEDVALTRITTDDFGNRHVRYRQTRDGLDVVGGDLSIHVDVKGTIYAVNGTARGDLPNFAGKTQIGEAGAIAAVARDLRFLSMSATGAGRQVYIILPDGAMTKAWETTFEGVRGLDPQLDRVYVSVDTGAIVAIHPQYHYALSRQVYSANNGTSLPGTLRRSEGGAATGDEAVDLAYLHSGDTYTGYQRFFNRDSYNNAGAALRSTVHYSTNYCNAFWNGSQMVYGDGNASQGCLPLARSLDVAAHELTHAVTDNESDLIYSGESGGINEAMSDIHAAFIEAWVDGGRDGTNLDPNASVFLIGDEVLAPFLRNMCDPAADGDSLDFWTTGTGGVDVHYSSGIANLAFCLLSRGGTHPRGKSTVNVAAIGMEKAIRLFYKLNVDHLQPSSNYAAARSFSDTAATELGFTAAEAQSVKDAWSAVGVLAAAPPAGDVVLTKGVTATGISGASGSQRFFSLVVPANSTNLTFTLSGGTGDADMYMRFGSKPTLTTYQCRPYRNGNSETCTVAAPQAGTYWIMLHGYTAYGNTTLKGDYTAGGGGGGDPYLSDGVPVSGISGAAGSNRYWRIAVPSGTAQLVVTLRPGAGSSTGDSDLYVRFGSRPTTSTYSCRSIGSANTETCTINNPAAGDHYILVRGYTAYNNVTLLGNY